MKACGMGNSPLCGILFLSWSQLEIKSVMGFDPRIHLGEGTPISNQRFFCTFEKVFLSWDLLHCRRDLSWLCKMDQMEGKTLKRIPLLRFSLSWIGKTVSPWDFIILLRLNPLDTFYGPSCYAWITTCETTSDLRIAVTVDWIKALTQRVVRDI